MRSKCFRDPWFLIGKEAFTLLQSYKEGGEEKVFETELLIGSVKAQSDRLKSLVEQLEYDERWEENSAYYAKEVYEIEKRLRIIRRGDLGAKIQTTYLNKN